MFSPPERFSEARTLSPHRIYSNASIMRNIPSLIMDWTADDSGSNCCSGPTTLPSRAVYYLQTWAVFPPPIFPVQMRNCSSWLFFSKLLLFTASEKEAVWGELLVGYVPGLTEPLLGFLVVLVAEKRLAVLVVELEEAEAVSLIEGPQTGAGPVPQPPVDGPALLGGLFNRKGDLDMPDDVPRELKR